LLIKVRREVAQIRALTEDETQRQSSFDCMIVEFLLAATQPG
jgi:hypothetical protein